MGAIRQNRRTEEVLVKFWVTEIPSAEILSKTYLVVRENIWEE